jgi:hypothetical protein
LVCFRIRFWARSIHSMRARTHNSHINWCSLVDFLFLQPLNIWIMVDNKEKRITYYLNELKYEKETCISYMH